KITFSCAAHVDESALVIRSWSEVKFISLVVYCSYEGGHIESSFHVLLAEKSLEGVDEIVRIANGLLQISRATCATVVDFVSVILKSRQECTGLGFAVWIGEPQRFAEVIGIERRVENDVDCVGELSGVNQSRMLLCH